LIPDNFKLRLLKFTLIRCWDIGNTSSQLRCVWATFNHFPQHPTAKAKGNLLLTCSKREFALYPTLLGETMRIFRSLPFVMRLHGHCSDLPTAVELRRRKRTQYQLMCVSDSISSHDFIERQCSVLTGLWGIAL
jgi:hypothetical protein